MKLLAVFLCLVFFAAPLRAEDAFPAPVIGVKGKKPAPQKGKPMPVEEVVPYVASFDTFGSSRLSEPKIRKLLGKELDTWLKAGLTGDPKANEMQAKLTKKIIKKYKFPFAEWSIMQYIEPGNLAIRITLDVVEKFDVAKRMPFYKKPTADIKDPKKLVENWYKYQETALQLADDGKLESFKIDCPGAYHCLFGHKHPRLKPFAKLFTTEVRRNKKALIHLMKNHKDGDKRAAATYLMAYIKNADELVSLMLDRIKDPDALVRNNALRVLGDIAEFHPQVKIPVKPILPALNYPLVTDRSKAAFLIFSLAEQTEIGRKAAIKHFPKILALLKSQQPNQSGVAYAILRTVSGKHFAPNEVSKWEKWYQRLPANQKK